ncbi:O-antigen ligase family protein [bacterium]|nr:O-antigen ligase family protein [bacterium]
MIIIAAPLVAWSETTWPIIFYIIYVLTLFIIGLRSSFALLVSLIALQPLIPYYPISFLKGAALQDIFYITGLFILLLFTPLKKNKIKLVLPLAIPYLCLALWAALGTFATQTSFSEILVSLAKGSGRPLVILLTALFTATVIKDFQQSNILLKFIVISATVEAIIGILAMIFNIEIIAGGLHLGVQNLPYLIAPEVPISRRLQGTFSTGNLTGAYFVVTIPLTLAFFLTATRTRQKYFFFLSAILQFIAMILTFTRTSIVAGIFTLLVFAFLYMRKGRMKAVIQVLFAISFALALLYYLLPEMVEILSARFLKARPEARLAPAYAGIQMILDYPIWGVGVDNAIPMMESERKYSLTPFGETTVRPHNSFIFIGAELGLPASFILLWAVIAITRFLIKTRALSRRPEEIALSNALMSAWIGELVHSLTNNLFHHPSLMVTLMAAVVALTPIFYSSNKLHLNFNGKGGGKE